MSGIKIAVVGAGGRMGRMIIESTLKDGEATLVAAVDQPGAPWIGKDAGELVGMRVEQRLERKKHASALEWRHFAPGRAGQHALAVPEPQVAVVLLFNQQLVAAREGVGQGVAHGYGRLSVVPP